MKCEFVGDANTVDGRIVPCTRNATVRLRLRGVDAILMGKKCVCPKHMELLLSPEVRVAKRDWQIDTYL
jgi:hypothetical protein